MKIAKALGLTVPLSLLGRANEVLRGRFLSTLASVGGVQIFLAHSGCVDVMRSVFLI